MNVNQAYKILTDKFQNKEVIKCFEFESIFSFTTVNKNDSDAEKSIIQLDSAFSVDKKTGEIKVFQPFFIPIEEYRNGKEIKDFK